MQDCNVWISECGGGYPPLYFLLMYILLIYGACVPTLGTYLLTQVCLGTNEPLQNYILLFSKNSCNVLALFQELHGIHARIKFSDEFFPPLFLGII